MRNKHEQMEGQVLQSVQNAARVLQMLEHNSSIRPADVGRALGLGRSTVHRLLVTLEHEGMLQRDRVERSYRAGRVLIGVGLVTVGGLDVRRRAHAYMEELRDATGETVHLHVLEGTNTRIVDAVEGTHLVRVASQQGELLPAHATAGGKALLAALPRKELHALLSRGLPRVTETTTTTWDEFDLEIDEIRRRGYATNFGESQASVCAIAVPVRDRTKRLAAALALAVPYERMTDDALLTARDEMRRQAARIGESLV